MPHVSVAPSPWTVPVIAGLSLLVAASGSLVATTRPVAASTPQIVDAPVQAAEYVAPSSSPSVPVTSPSTAPSAAAPPTAAKTQRAAAPTQEIAGPLPVVTQPVTTTAPKPATSSAPAPRTRPATGTYTTAQSGSASMNGSPQTVAPTGSLVVDGAGGSDYRLRSSGGPAEVTMVLRYGATSADLVSLQLKTSQLTKTLTPSSLPRFLVFGSSPSSWNWSATSTDGKTTVSATVTRGGSTTVNVGGTNVAVEVLETVMQLRGDVVGTMHLTSWISTADRLPVRQRQVIDATASMYGFSVPFDCDLTATLTSRNPS